MRQSAADKDLNTEAEESTLLGAVTRRQVKANLEDVAHAIVDCKVRKLEETAIITFSYEFQESSKSNYQSKPRL
jgi:hypothetical protein